jgi:diguanylate cyclase (GGDEF)-like protein/PAS domain S-box-containing protein
MSNSDFIQKPPATLSIDDDQAPGEWAKVNLAALAALLNLDGEHDSFRDLFQALKPVFAFDRALVLADAGDGIRCIAAEPALPAGRHWPDKSLRDALHVRTTPADGACYPDDIRDVLADLAGLGQAALLLPIGVSTRSALLLLLRAPGAKDFSDTQIAIARLLATVTLAMLAARKAAGLEADIECAKALAQSDHQPVHAAQPSDRLLSEIIDNLPIGLTVQDDNGRFVLVNAMAAANLAMPADALIGASPTDLLPQDEAASRHEWEQELIQHGKMATVETSIPVPGGWRTWRTLHQPARILDRTLLISSAIDVTEYRQAARELTDRLHVDELTGLPDRILIQECVDAVIREDDGRQFALAFIDLDNFKHINDYHSHAVGDALLVKIGERITRRLRHGDMLARVGGDEFLLLLDPFDGEENVRSLVGEILRDLKQPFQIEAFEVFSSCSIGVGIYPEHGRSYEALRRNADSAMYRAKHVAKGSAVFFDRDIALAANARTQAEQRLRLAIRDKKLCCAFHPKVDIHSEEVVGFEALVRWRDDDGEIHPPGDFIGLAIELGLIDPITNFVVAEAINAIDRLDASFGPKTTISINVAAKQAGNLEFMQSLVQTLSSSSHVERIMIELTEDALISRGAFQTQVLPMLREIGVRVSIDDFGTGYSSLGALADITADEIKIDRSFITGIHERPRSQSVLRAIESLGHALNMTIVAEGVETFEELTYLRTATRIRYVQGFYFAKPFYLEDIDNSLDIGGRVHEAARPRPELREAVGSRELTTARSRG